MQKAALGRGLDSLIPQKKSIVEEVIPDAKQEILEVPVGQIEVNPHQPRKDFSAAALEDLISSIKEHGIIQPLVVTRMGPDKYELIAGERRLRASTTLGLKTVPAIVRDVTEQQKLELALIENIQREQLNAAEEAFSYKALIEEFNLTQEQAADRVGKSRSVVANTLRLLDLPDEMLQALREGKISKSHARTLLAEADQVKRDQLFKAMLRGEVTVRQAEKSVAKKKVIIKDPNISAHEKKLREILGTKVLISERAGKGKVSIDFYSKEELLDLLDRLTSL